MKEIFFSGKLNIHLHKRTSCPDLWKNKDWTLNEIEKIECSMDAFALSLILFSFKVRNLRESKIKNSNVHFESIDAFINVDCVDKVRTQNASSFKCRVETAIIFQRWHSIYAQLRVYKRLSGSV